MAAAFSEDVVDARFGALFREERLCAVLRHQLDHQAVGVVGIAEVGRASDARGGALGQLAHLESMQTEVALSCVAFRGVVVLADPRLAVLVAWCLHPGRLGSEDDHLGLVGSLRDPGDVGLAEVRRARAIGAGGDAVAAADALVVVNGHDAVGPLPRRVHRTDWHARRLVALHTGPWGEAELDLREDPKLLLDDRAVHHTRWQIVLRHTRDRARIAPHTLAGIDDHDPGAFLDRLRHGLDQITLHPQEYVLVGLRWDIGQDLQEPPSTWADRVPGRTGNASSTHRNTTKGNRPCNQRGGSDCLSASQAAAHFIGLIAGRSDLGGFWCGR